MSESRVELGLRENAAQFTLLVAINALVGAMVGLERSTLPLIGADDFGLTSTVVVLSFIVAFGLAKSFTNLAAGALAERIGRRRLLIAGWAIALPVPLLIGVAPSWGWVVAANVFLGVNQGLAWSMTVLMKIDLVGPRQRGLALGLNESAGYGGVALAAAASGWLAAEFAARDVLVVAAAVIAVTALVVSAIFVRDTACHVALEQEAHPASPTSRLVSATPFSCLLQGPRAPRLLPGRPGQQLERRARLGSRPAVPRRSWRRTRVDRASSRASTRRSGASGQIWTGHWSDRVGRKRPIVGGMLLQAAALGLLSASGGDLALAAGGGGRVRRRHRPRLPHPDRLDL